MTDSTAPTAERPLALPRRAQIAALKRVQANMTSHHLSTLAAGVAFFGLLSIFPAIGALVMIAGIVIDRSQMADLLDQLAAALPQEAATIITDQVQKVVTDEQSALSVALVLSLLLSLYSASTAIRTLMDGLNAANGEIEKRGMVRLYLTSLALTLLLIVGFILACAVTLAAPILLETLSAPDWIDKLVTILRWPVFAVFAVLGLGILYRFGPSRSPARWRWLTPGAVTGTMIWVLGSIAFSVYVRNFGSYTETYGALGGAIILLLWLWLSAFIVLLGAELNVELERATIEDTTVGGDQPMGKRGAVAADTPPPSDNKAEAKAKSSRT